jgi:hypothetical protein
MEAKLKRGVDHTNPLSSLLTNSQMLEARRTFSEVGVSGDWVARNEMHRGRRQIRVWGYAQVGRNNLIGALLSFQAVLL